jgi:hypothetical protein
MTKNTKALDAPPMDEDLAKLIQSGSVGIETAMQVLEGAEHVYYGALTATTMPVVVTTSATTPLDAEVS